MLHGIVKRYRAIKVHSAFCYLACVQQRHAHKAMADHQRDCGPLLLGQCDDLRREVAQHVAVERQKVRGPDAVEDRKQQQRVFERLSECFGLFDQQTCPLGSRLGFRCSLTS